MLLADRIAELCLISFTCSPTTTACSRPPPSVSNCLEEAIEAGPPLLQHLPHEIPSASKRRGAVYARVPGDSRGSWGWCVQGDPGAAKPVKQVQASSEPTHAPVRCAQTTEYLLPSQAQREAVRSGSGAERLAGALERVLASGRASVVEVERLVPARLPAAGWTGPGSR